MTATAVEWRNRGVMQEKADHHQLAYDDFMRAVEIDPNDKAALDGLVTTATILGKSAEAAARLQPALRLKADASLLIALSKLLAADGKRDEALARAQEAIAIDRAAGMEQLASLYADSSDSLRLDTAVAELRTIAARRASTEFFAAVAAFLHGDPVSAVSSANAAIDLDPNYSATYDLIGAAYTQLGKFGEARRSFEKSIEFNPHDSTAYTNLGVIELKAGSPARAAKYFSEALWLDSESQTAREGLAQARR
jgi:Flp pilus assembly protein TadD